MISNLPVKKTMTDRVVDVFQKLVLWVTGEKDFAQRAARYFHKETPENKSVTSQRKLLSFFSTAQKRSALLGPRRVNTEGLFNVLSRYNDVKIADSDRKIVPSKRKMDDEFIAKLIIQLTKFNLETVKLLSEKKIERIAGDNILICCKK